ncbi:MAG: hypothetical protein LUE12_07320 [Ruminococcus sp.]|nr:hypothetical protein [Ruminococcus sp.]
MSEEQEKSEEKLVDYSSDETYDRKHAMLLALLKWLECDFFGAFIFLSLLAMTLMLGNAGNFIFGTIGLLLYICVLADFGLKEGAKAHTKKIIRGDDTGSNFGLKLGLVAMLPALFSYILLLMSYFDVVGSTVLIFKILNSGLWGYINIFAPSMQIEDVSSTLLIIYPLTMLIYPLTVFFTFKMAYNNVDIKTKIMYKNQ